MQENIVNGRRAIALTLPVNHFPNHDSMIRGKHFDCVIIFTKHNNLPLSVYEKFKQIQTELTNKKLRDMELPLIPA